jgi:hypothetical protein
MSLLNEMGAIRIRLSINGISLRLKASNSAGIRLERKRLACLLEIAVKGIYGERFV